MTNKDSWIHHVPALRGALTETDPTAKEKAVITAARAMVAASNQPTTGFNMAFLDAYAALRDAVRELDAQNPT